MSREAEFERELKYRIKTARKKCNPRIGTRLLQMISEHGAVRAVKILLQEDKIQTGLIQLWKCKCLEISVEDLVCQFRDIFSEEEVEIARKRLRELNYLCNEFKS